MAYTLWCAGELVGHVASADFGLADDARHLGDGLETLLGWFYATPRFESIKPTLEKLQERFADFPGFKEALAVPDAEASAEFERVWNETDAPKAVDQMTQEHERLRLELRDASGAAVPSHFAFVQPWPAGTEDFPISDADRAALIAQGVNLNSPAMFMATLGNIDEGRGGTQIELES